MHLIHYFSSKGDLEAVKAQVKSGSAEIINLKEETLGETALHLAVNRSHIEVVKFSISHFAQMDAAKALLLLCCCFSGLVF